MNCIVCGNEGVNMVNYSEVNRGGRGALICPACLKVKRIAVYEAGTDSKPSLKDINSRLEVSVCIEDEEIFPALRAKMKARKGDMTSIAHDGSPRYKLVDAEHTRLNAACNFLRKTLPAIGGCRITRLEWTAVTGKFSNTYDSRTDFTELANSPADWLLEVEDDWCNRMGFTTSAKKTGTRK